MMATLYDNLGAAAVKGGARQLWAGRVVSGLAVAFLAMDGVMKLVGSQAVVQATAELGWPTDTATLTTLGVVLLGSTLLYALPRTSLLGAVLLTGYLGGAVATHARIGSPVFSHTLFGVYVGLSVWGGLWLRDARLRAFIS
jgi:hypothetical protein